MLWIKGINFVYFTTIKTTVKLSECYSVTGSWTEIEPQMPPPAKTKWVCACVCMRVAV